MMSRPCLRTTNVRSNGSAELRALRLCLDFWDQDGTNLAESGMAGHVGDGVFKVLRHDIVPTVAQSCI